MNNNNNSNNLKKKGVLLAISILLLVAAGIYFTLAWYTKMTSVSGLEFDVAKWDYSANYSIGDYQLNVYEYSNVNGDKAAPGTAGEIPIVLTATSSDDDVEYKLTIDKSTMSPEFQERIFFYEDPEMEQMITETSSLTGVIERGGESTVTVYWKWIYEFGEIPTGYGKVENETAESFDEFDTEVGKHPDLYEPKMNATIVITGLQEKPKQTDATSTG